MQIFNLHEISNCFCFVLLFFLFLFFFFLWGAGEGGGRDGGGNKKKYLSMSSAENFTQSAKRYLACG